MKFRTFFTAHKGLVKDVITSTCLLGGSAGIVFGVSAATFKINYIDLNNAQSRFAAWKSKYNYESQRITSCWNMDDRVNMPDRKMNYLDDWKQWHPGAADAPFLHSLGIDKPEGQELTPDEYNNRFNYTTMVIDGATHSIMDRSFNQSLFEGLADFNKNKRLSKYDIEMVDALKPSQDNPADFITTYTSAIKYHSFLGLAGFNHTTPLERMMQHYNDSPYASIADEATNKLAQKSIFLLLDAAIANNQCVASVLFRADQPGFLTGMATCSYLIHNLQLYHDHYQPISVAEYGGVSIPSVTIYMGGFQRGIELFNHEVIYQSVDSGAAKYFGYLTDDTPVINKRADTFSNVLLPYSKYKAEIEAIMEETQDGEERYNLYNERGLKKKIEDEFTIKMIRLGDASNHFSGTFAAGDAIGITKQYLNRGASAIICVAGPQSLDSAQEIQNQNSKAIVIGVDTAMENSDYQKYHNGCNLKTNSQQKCGDAYYDNFADKDGLHSSQSHAIIKFSAIKDLKSITKKIVTLAANGENWDKTISDPSGKLLPDPDRAVCGPGFQTCGNILNSMVSISWDGFVPLLDALQHIEYSIPNENEPLSLEEAWPKALDKFNNITPLPEDYKLQAQDINNLMTYNRYDADGNETILSKNYIYTTGILGVLLDFAKIKFNSSMSLRPVDEDQPIPDLSKGFTTIPSDESRDYSILQWLDYNMYLTD